MRKFVQTLIVPIIIGIVAAAILIKQFPQLLQPTVAINTASNSAPPLAGPVSYASAVDKAAPAVVNIYTTTVIRQAINPIFNEPFFRQFLGSQNIPTRERLQSSLGSGVILTSDGYLLTNNHVVENADSIVVALRDGRNSKARVIGTDPDTDLAVLKIDLDNLPAASVMTSDTMRIGDVVLAIGNPFGVGQTVTMGIISATGRHELGLNTYEDFIQTDAAINPGNSGGALIDAVGNLIGINTAIFSKSGGSQGIGFAIPSKLAIKILQEIINHGHVVRGWLGLSVQDVTQQQLAKAKINLNQNALLVTELSKGGPAYLAGLLPGDLILALDSKQNLSGREAMNYIAQTKPATNVVLTVLRKGNQQTLTATIVEKAITPTKSTQP